MSDYLALTIENGVATVLLNRPEKHNAVTLQMFAELAATGSRLAADKTVRAVVLQGAGPSFCAGIDVGIFRQDGAPFEASKMQAGDGSPANFFQRAAYVWREIPVPVICALHGSVFGAGLQIALGADLRIASEDCRLSFREIHWGLMPDMAVSITLAGLVTPDRAKELAWTGRTVNGSEAYNMGLVTSIDQHPAEAARQAALAIAARSPEAVRGIKTLFDSAGDMSIADALRLEAQLQSALLGSANQREAVAAHVERRAPSFEDPKG